MSAALQQPDIWAAWKSELAGQPRALAAGEFIHGFFEARTREGRMPVRIWFDNDTSDWVAQVGTNEEFTADADFAERVFSRAKAISYAVYGDVLAGKGWPDEVVLPEHASEENPHADRPNTPPAEHILLQDQIDELRREADKWLAGVGGKVTTQEHADKAAAYKVRFAELETKAKAGKATEKKPVLDEATRLETLWKPVIEAGGSSKSWAAGLTDAFLRAETARKVAEAAAKAAEGKPVRASDLKVKAGTGRGVSMVTTDILVLDDADAAWTHVVALKPFRDDPDVQRVMKRMALAALKAGFPVPGARIEQEQKPR